MKRISAEDIDRALREAQLKAGYKYVKPPFMDEREVVAQAQLDADREEVKEIFEWGDENCTEHTHKNYGSKVKRECCYCWQALKKSI